MSYALLRPFLFNMDPEHAHEMTLSLLDKAHKARVLGLAYGQSMQPTDCMGLQFSNPVVWQQAWTKTAIILMRWLS